MQKAKVILTHYESSIFILAFYHTQHRVNSFIEYILNVIVWKGVNTMIIRKLGSTAVTAAMLLMILSFAGVSADTYEYHHHEERHEYSSHKQEYREYHKVRSTFGHDVFMTHMNGGQETPKPGDPDGRGIAVVHINRDGHNKVCTFLKVKDIAKSTAAHIHKAPRGQAGPVVLPLPTPDDHGKTSGCIDASAELVREIAEHPDQFYVNVHTGEYPDGAVRGQLR